MKKNNKITGNRGEDLAIEFLENKGYLIEERNFRTRFGEIDIVCWDRDILVFVEVKTKIGHDFGEPEEMINKGKLAKVQRMGEMYCLLKIENTDPSASNCGARIAPDALRLHGPICAPNLTTDSSGSGETAWRGRCRMDVVGVVLNDDLSLERIKHYEAVY